MGDIEDQARNGSTVEEEEAAKLRKRAERFGTTLVDTTEPPALDKELGTEKYSKPRKFEKKSFTPNKEHFDPGIDLITKEEEEKRETRAARFGTNNQTLDYKALPPADEENEAKKKERAARFGTEYQATDQSGQQDQDLWESRREQSAEVARRPEAIHLYGVDVMSTHEVLAYFGKYNPQSVEWIDDSSCNVVFSSEAAAKRAIVSHGRPFKAGEAPELQGLDPGNIEHLPFVWHKGQDFQKNSGPPVPLIYRMATAEDQKGRAKAKSSRYLWRAGARPKKTGRQQKRLAVEMDEEGDVIMGGDGQATRKRRKAKKRRQRGPNGKEVEMEDAEDQPDASGVEGMAEDEGISGNAAPEGKDLRDVLREKRGKALPGTNRLFSAAAAGILPRFLESQNKANKTQDDVPETAEPVQEVRIEQDGDVDMG